MLFCILYFQVEIGNEPYMGSKAVFKFYTFPHTHPQQTNDCRYRSAEDVIYGIVHSWNDIQLAIVIKLYLRELGLLFDSVSNILQ